MQLAQTCQMPYDSDTSVASDLKFAAYQCVLNRHQAREVHKRSLGVLRELSRRCQALTLQLRSFQPPTVQQVAGQVHIALIAVLSMMMQWPDWRLAQRFVTGFPTTGILERTGLHAEIQVQAPLHVEDLLKNAPALFSRLENQRVSDEVEFLYSSCLKEEQQGWASHLLPKEQMDRQFPAGWSPIPSFCHVQACGKKRRIDDAKAGMQNAATSYTEKAQMCSAFQPCIN
eukprot:4214896-Amphidinium_carterae.1